MAYAQRKINPDDAWANFVAANSAQASWIISKRDRFDFAASMESAVRRFGSLTERQAAAVNKFIEGDAARIARTENAPAVETDRLMAAFDKALASKLKRPVMRFELFRASLAPATGINAGAVYIKANNDEGTYLGKIMGGKFIATSRTTEAEIAAVRSTMADPLAAAVAYGRRTGNCCCCGRELSDPVSVENGIGPICAMKFGL